MKLKLAASLLISASIVSSTAFAHISLKGETVPMPSYNWTGFYAGVNLGAVSHTMTTTDNAATTFNASLDQVTNPKFTGGFQIGYRQQIDPSRDSGVYGVEFSENFSNASFSRQYGSPFALYQLDVNNKLKSICLLELTGGIPADKTLLFLAAGLSLSHLTGSTTSLGGTPFFNKFDVDKKAFGTVLGAGIEYAFTPEFTARFKVDVVMPKDYSTSDDSGDAFQISNHIVQGTIGLNYRFA